MRILKWAKYLTAGELAELVWALVVVLSAAGIAIASLFAADFTEAALWASLATILVAVLRDRIRLPSEAALVEIPVRSRQAAFDQLTESPEEWVFKGGLGRWFRQNGAEAAAKAVDESTAVRAVILDPRDEGSCAAYALYRKRSGYYKDHTNESRGVQAEVLATVAALLSQASTSRVRPQVGFTRTHSPLRADCNGREMIFTTPNRDIKTLKVRNGHWLYKAIVDEVTEILETGPRVEIRPIQEGIDLSSPESVRLALEQFDITFADGRSEKLLGEYAEAESIDWGLVCKAINTEWTPAEGRHKA